MPQCFEKTFLDLVSLGIFFIRIGGWGVGEGFGITVQVGFEPTSRSSVPVSLP